MSINKSLIALSMTFLIVCGSAVAQQNPPCTEGNHKCGHYDPPKNQPAPAKHDHNDGSFSDEHIIEEELKQLHHRINNRSGSDPNQEIDKIYHDELHLRKGINHEKQKRLNSPFPYPLDISLKKELIIS